jgi:UDPglucose 6-dehydrogenase
MRVTMIGAGYVGLVTGTCLANAGHTVICIDKDEKKIAALNVGRIPIYEPGLTELVASNVGAGRLSFSTDLAEGMRGAQAVFIAVGTPPRPEDGVADLRYVLGAAEDIARNASNPVVVVTKSTVPVGTGDRIERILRQTRPEMNFDVVSNPEFLREGDAISDFQNPDRIVIGSESPRATSVMRDIYASFIDRDVSFVVSTRRSSELIKYASNAFLAMKVTFINEMADLCEGTGAEVADVALGMGLDSRIGPKFLRAGPGFGGSCFPKDILALLKCANDAGTSMRLVESTIGINESRKRAMARRIADVLGGDIFGKTVAILGLTFKPETDDMRDSPAITIVRSLQDQGAIVRACDPKAGAEAASIYPGVELFRSALEAAAGADTVVLMTEWDAYRKIAPAQLASVMSGRIAIDLRNVWDPAAFQACGFDVHCVGRKSNEAARKTESAAPFKVAGQSLPMRRTLEGSMRPQ